MSHEQEPRRGRVDLSPARYGDSGGLDGFRWAFPWRVLLGIALVVSFIISLHLYLTHRKVEALRAEVTGLIDEEIVPVRNELLTLREKIRGLVLAAYRSQEFHAPFVDPGFSLEAMREAPALTLRLGRRGSLGDDEVELVVEHGASDDIASCLGVPNLPASELYEGGDFLGEGFAEEVERANTELELRGLLDQLERRIHQVLPDLRKASRSGLLILAIDRPNEGAVEVSVIDLKAGEDRLRVLARAEGKLLSAKVELGDVRTRREALDLPELRGAADCGVASQIRAILPDEAAGQPDEAAGQPDEAAGD